MTATATAPVLTDLSEDELLGLFHGDSQDMAQAAVRELRRRDRKDDARETALQARRADPVTAEWLDAAHAQYMQAEAECAGKLVRRGSRVTDAWSLWSGPEWLARQNGTEELGNFWDDNPRIPTVTEWRHQLDDGHRIQDDETGRDTYGTETPAEEATMIGHIAGSAVRAASYAGQANRMAELQRECSDRAAELGRSTAIVRQREVIDGDETLRYIYTMLRRFAVWGSEAEIVTATLWIAHTHARDGKGVPIWQYCARLGIFGPSGSGKSWKARLVGKLSYAGEILVEPTKPAFIDLCADHHTVILTEADEAFRSPGRSRGILAVVNASYEPDRSASRKQGGVAVKIPLFTPIVLDGIDTLLSATREDLRAMVSRCIIIRARQAPEGYRPPRFDAKARDVAEKISQRASAWMAQEAEDGMADDVPDIPEHLGNRPFALWEPLFTVARRADMCAARRDGTEYDGDGAWSAAVRAACEQLEAGSVEQPEETKGELDRIMAEWEDE